MSAPSTTRPALVPERLAHWAQARPDAVAFTWLQDGVNASASVTWGELHGRALALGAALRERVPAGARVLLVLPPGLENLIALQACFAAGLVGVPVAIPSARRAAGDAGRIRRVAEDSGATAVLSLRSIADLLAADPVLPGAPWLLAEDWPAADRSVELPAPAPRDLAYLQYTSGSTSKPRGVMLANSTFAANLALIAERTGLGEESRVYTWVPPWHDLGLVGGILTGIVVGATTYLAPPTAVIRAPLAWLQGLTAHAINATGGPDFAYRLAAERIAAADAEQLDLSALQIAYTGAEPIRPVTLARFSSAFAVAGFDPDAFFPCYGLAESTLVAVCKRSPGAAHLRGFERGALGGGEAVPLGAALSVAEGRAHAGVVGADASTGVVLVGHGEAPADRIAIVDPETLQPLPDGQIGEILITGPDVAGGYWERPDLTPAVFGVRVVGDPDTPWLRSGDLGFRSGGELFVSGRTKDVIIVNGVNYHAVDLETAAQEADPSLRTRPVAAFAEEPTSARAVVVIEAPSPDLEAGPEADALVSAVRRAVALATEVTPARVVLTRPHTLPRTTSGKIQRARCRDGLAYGMLPVIAEWPPAAPRTEGAGS